MFFPKDFLDKEKNVITKNYLPVPSKRRSGILMKKVGFIVAHDTGNKNSTALQNISYYKNSANEMSASAHIFVDDENIIECIPSLKNPEKAWHVLYEKPLDNAMFGDDSNDIAIGVELCYFDDPIKSRRAYINYVNTIAYLCYMYDLSPKAQIIGHSTLDPERKTDPENAFKRINLNFQTFIGHVTIYYNKFLELDGWNTAKQNLFNKEVEAGAIKNDTLIRYNLTKEKIIEIQKMLLSLGYKLDDFEASGNYNIYTKNAIANFQKDFKAYPIDGICGAVTYQKLTERYIENRRK